MAGTPTTTRVQGHPPRSTDDPVPQNRATDFTSGVRPAAKKTRRKWVHHCRNGRLHAHPEHFPGHVHDIDDPHFQTHSADRIDERLIRPARPGFSNLDSQVRYAYEIWQPYQGTPSTDHNWDIEYESTFNGAIYPTCAELQYNFHSGELLSASWTQGTTVTPSFKILANDLTGTGDPFQVIQNSSNSKVQLMVTLSATSGTGGGTETTTSSVTFTVLNSLSYQAASTSNTQCTASWTSA